MESSPNGEDSSQWPPPGEEDRASPLELFFDLVFVFAITQISTLLASDLTWNGFARSCLIFVMIWWAWAAYTWATNAHDLSKLKIRFAVLAATAAAFFVSISVPDAFGSGGLTFAVAFAVMRVVHLALLISAAQHEHTSGYRHSLPIMGGAFLVASALVIIGGVVDGELRPWLWLLAIGIDVAGPQLTRANVDKIQLWPGHFAERYALIVIVALGETVVAIGLGASKAGFGLAVTLSVLVSILITSALWWAYFDFVAGAAERRLKDAIGTERASLARDGFTYLHFPIIAGIILFAVGAKDLVAHPSDPLDAAHRWCLLGGVALYLLGHMLFRLRMVKNISWERLAVVATVLIVGKLLENSDALLLACMLLLALTALLIRERFTTHEARRALVEETF